MRTSLGTDSSVYHRWDYPREDHHVIKCHDILQPLPHFHRKILIRGSLSLLPLKVNRVKDLVACG